MQKRVLFLLVSAFLFAGILQAQNSLNLDLDYAHFRADEFQNYVEIYYSLYPEEWTYFRTAQGDTMAEVAVQLSLFNADSLIDLKAWKVQQKKGAPGEHSARLDLIRYRLDPGKYRAVMIVKDLHNPDLTKKSEMEIANLAFPRTQLTVSDIELCRSIKNAGKNSDPVMVKNGFEVIPDASRLFGPPFPVIFFYVEIYNLQEGIQGGMYTVNYFVTDYDGKKVDGVRQHTRTHKILGNNAAEVGMVNIAKLPSGTYWLYFVVSDSAKEHMAYTRTRFYCYNPEMDAQRKEQQVASNTGRVYSIYESMAPIQIENELQYIRYIATKEEKKIIKSLKDLDAKKSFLVEFWAKRDPDPDRPGNKFRDEYLERVRFANKQFSGMEEGWKTDFGRVYILYGPPTNVERFPNTMNGRAYQVWTYENLQGGAEFVFIDFGGYQHYQLVHSTYRGEIQNWDWRKMLELNYQHPPNPDY